MDYENYDIEKLKQIINDLEEKNTPLTIPKKPKEKVKKPMSDLKKAQFEAMVEKRKKQVEDIRNSKKLQSAKILLKEVTKEEVKKELPKQEEVKKELPKKDIKYKEKENSEEEEEEIIYLSKKSKPKKKIKKIIIQESESETESESEQEEIIKKPVRNFKSAQNKKSVIKVHQPSQEYNYNPNNFFV